MIENVVSDNVQFLKQHQLIMVTNICSLQAECMAHYNKGNMACLLKTAESMISECKDANFDFVLLQTAIWPDTFGNMGYFVSLKTQPSVPIINLLQSQRIHNSAHELVTISRSRQL